MEFMELQRIHDNKTALGLVELLFYEQGKRSGKAVQKASVSYRTNFSVAKETRKAQGPQLLLDHLGVMVRLTKQALAAPITAAEAAPVDWGLL